MVDNADANIYISYFSNCGWKAWYLRGSLGEKLSSHLFPQLTVHCSKICIKCLRHIWLHWWEWWLSGRSMESGKSTQHVDWGLSMHFSGIQGLFLAEASVLLILGWGKWWSVIWIWWHLNAQVWWHLNAQVCVGFCETYCEIIPKPARCWMSM